jgi:hypothetical protein
MANMKQRMEGVEKDGGIPGKAGMAGALASSSLVENRLFSSLQAGFRPLALHRRLIPQTQHTLSGIGGLKYEK